MNRYSKWNPLKDQEYATFSFEINSFVVFLVNRLLDSNKGVNLLCTYEQYRKETNKSASNHELYQYVEDFYLSIKNTGMVLMRKQNVSIFPQTAGVCLFNIN